MNDFVTGLIFAFLGSLHCVGMCGPIALALSAQDPERTQFVLGRLFYNGGRTLTYMALGLVAGVIGKGVALAGIQQILSMVLGGMLVVTAIFPILQNRFLTNIPGLTSLTQAVSRRLGGLLGRRSLPALMLIGLANGLLPCGFVYLALAAAITTADVVRSVVFMAGFGLGTIPVMMSISLLGKTIPSGIRMKLRMVMPVLTILLGVLLILRGMNLGIPYVSPRVVTQQATHEVMCH